VWPVIKAANIGASETTVRVPSNDDPKGNNDRASVQRMRLRNPQKWNSSAAPTCSIPRLVPPKKADPRKVAKDGFKAMMAGEGGVVSGWQQVGSCGSARDAGREAGQEAYRNGGARDGEKKWRRPP